MSDRIGLECKLYQAQAMTGETGPGDATWTELTSARDVTVTLEASEVDMSSRRNGWNATRAAMRDATLEFELLWDGEDQAIQALRDAYLNGTKIALAAMDGDISAEGSQGFVANFYITGFTRNEPMGEGVTVSVTAKPYEKQQWYEVPAA